LRSGAGGCIVWADAEELSRVMKALNFGIANTCESTVGAGASVLRGRAVTKEIPYLDGLRGIAALWVMVAHCMIWGGWPVVQIPDPKIAVDLFILISGFLMVSNARNRESTEPMTEWRSWAIFYVRRFFRLAPAYYLSLLLVIVLVVPFSLGYKALELANPTVFPVGNFYDPDNFHFSPDNVLVHLSLLFGLVPRYASSTMLPDWTLSLEWQFYLVFPAIYVVMRKLGAIPVAAVLGALAFAITFKLPGVFPEPAFLPLKLSVFLAGMLIAELAHGVGRAASLGIAGLSFILIFAQGSQYGVQAPLLAAVCAAMLLLSAPQAEKVRLIRRVNAALGGRLGRFLSKTSYGVYLFHGFFIAFGGYVMLRLPIAAGLSGQGRTIALFLVVLPCSYACGALLNRYVERPGISLGSSITRRIRSLGTPVHPAPNPGR
jgi:peptidoglycan/LPS O-acetylase OafA/YrhL